MSRIRHSRPRIKGTSKALLELITALLQRKKYIIINKKELKQLLDSNHDITIVDCRDPHTFSVAGHIVGAINLPYTDFIKRCTRIPTDNPIVVVCYVGAYSRAASQALANNGYGPVMSLQGGMEGWIDYDYPVTKK